MTPTNTQAARDVLAELVALVRGECPSLLDEDSGGNACLSMAIDDALAAQPDASGEAPRWLWRVWNLGFTDGHESGSNEWGSWNLISAEDATRLAADDHGKRYEFVPYRVTAPTPAQPTPEPGMAEFILRMLVKAGHVSQTKVDEAYAIAAKMPAAQPSENERLRYMLAVRVAGAKLYGDDGELQDNSVLPFIDFKRDSAADIEEKLIERGMRNFASEMSASLAAHPPVAPKPASLDLIEIVGQILDAGHMNTEDLARLRAAFDGAEPVAPQSVRK